MILRASKGKVKVKVDSHGRQCAAASPEQCSLNHLSDQQVRELARILSHAGFKIKLET